MEFKYKPKTQLQASYRETNTKPNQSQPNQIKRSEHTVTQSKQLRDQSEQTCNPQRPLSVNTKMLKKTINRKWSKLVKRIGNKKNDVAIPDKYPLEPSFQLPFSSSPQKVSSVPSPLSSFSFFPYKLPPVPVKSSYNRDFSTY